MQLKLNYMLINVYIPELNRDFLGTIGNYLYLCNRYQIRTENKNKEGLRLFPFQSYLHRKVMGFSWFLQVF